jgi:hypothetical protein
VEWAEIMKIWYSLIRPFHSWLTSLHLEGDAKLEPLKRGQKTRTVYPLKSTTAAKAVNYGMYGPESTWNRCSSVVSESLDECFIGSWIFAQSATDKVSDILLASLSTHSQDSTISGRISEILTGSTAAPVVVLEVFQILSVWDDIYGMPVLVRRHGETTVMIIPAKVPVSSRHVQLYLLDNSIEHQI